ncbi:MAG: hypothetical protein U9Q96_00555 [Patescibacteria group bacterium]|nr:hypothetical protein [Patescibacteria group bacterium]
MQRPKKIHFKANPKVFCILSITLTISLIGILVFQTQLLAQKSEFVSSSQKELTELLGKENQDTPLLSSGEISELTQLAQNLNFEKIDKVHYISAIQSTVLAK